jgi:hypothetical protein
MYEDAQEFLVNLIEPEVWDRAVWRGVAFLWQEGQPPSLAFMFADDQNAREIFAGLRAKVGAEDEEELLRICIIQGSFDGNDRAYCVNIGPNFHNVLRHFGHAPEIDPSETHYSLSRFLRINPRSLEPLTEFKRRFQRFGSCRVIPSVVVGGTITPLDELGILKRELVFRNQSDIQQNDEDAIALKKESPPSR